MTEAKGLRALAATLHALARMALGLTFALSGFVKAVDPMGTAYKIADYLAAMGLGRLLPEAALTGASVALSCCEALLGVALLFGVRRRLVAALAFITMIAMTAISVWLVAADPIGDCGCFGDAIVLTNPQTLAKNIVLLALAAAALWHAASTPRLVMQANEWIVMNYSVLFIATIAAVGLYDLPLLDFRPYRVGADLRTADIEHDGDIVDSLIDAQGPALLLIAPHIEKADASMPDDINMAYEFARERGMAMVCLTASGDEAINVWRDITGAEYPIRFADETMLKTMVRSNPGLIAIAGGRVRGKWSCNRMPDEAKLAEATSLQPADGDGRRTTAMKIALWYLLPLFLLTLADRTWMWTRWIRTKHKDNINKPKMRKNIVAGNWKMNLCLQEGLALVKDIEKECKAQKPNCDVIVCTPFPHLGLIPAQVDQDIVAIGAENCADKEKGAYTGEVSAAMVKSTGARYVILGHSERRGYYHETPEILRDKVQLALANGLKVIFCIGESLEEREQGKQNEVVKAELEGSVFCLTAEEWKNIVIAYEPIWAIGTGKTATSDQAEEIHAYIRSVVADKYGKAAADDTTILYGGSCKASNAPELFAKPDIDGGLIGGASLKCPDFMGIVRAF